MRQPICYKGDEPYIFVSYAHRDDVQVWPILDRMQRDGYRVWYDEGIDPGAEWPDTIAAHVEQCGFFIAFLSEGYLDSDNCKDELNFARELGKERLMIHLSPVELPVGMRMQLSRYQAIHWYSYEDQTRAFAKLYETKGLSAFRGEDPSAAPPEEETAGEGDRAQEENADAAALYQRGWQCFERSDYAGAAACYRRAAQQGHAGAQNSLGWMYQRGQGVSRDDGAAAEWYLRAAQQGHAGAQYALGWLYQHGRGVSRDNGAAAEWYLQAAQQGHAGAQNSLGWLYQRGLGVSQDNAAAVEWYRRAAEQGHAGAQNNLGWMYQAGKGVSQDVEEAVRWYRKAADQGNEKARSALAKLGRQDGV